MHEPFSTCMNSPLYLPELLSLLAWTPLFTCINSPSYSTCIWSIITCIFSLIPCTNTPSYMHVQYSPSYLHEFSFYFQEHLFLLAWTRLLHELPFLLQPMSELPCYLHELPLVSGAVREPHHSYTVWQAYDTRFLGWQNKVRFWNQSHDNSEVRSSGLKIGFMERIVL